MQFLMKSSFFVQYSFTVERIDFDFILYLIFKNALVKCEYEVRNNFITRCPTPTRLEKQAPGQRFTNLLIHVPAKFVRKSYECFTNDFVRRRSHLRIS